MYSIKLPARDEAVIYGPEPWSLAIDDAARGAALPGAAAMHGGAVDYVIRMEKNIQSDPMRIYVLHW